jgi:hypothetical protein
MASPYDRALAAIDAAHSLDPNTHTTAKGLQIPYELHYAQKCTEYLEKLCLSSSNPPSEALRLAIRAQHFRRWEVPRNTYPMTKVGYHSWRNYLKRRMKEGVESVCKDSGLPEDVVTRVGSLVSKEGLVKAQRNREQGASQEGKNDTEEDKGYLEEVQILEDVACLVFLEDQFEGWEKQAGLEEEKVLGILRRSWAKMSEAGRDLALKIEMGDRGRMLVGKALSGDDEKEG